MTRSSPITPIPEELNLKRYFDLALRSWRVILLCGVLGVATAFVWSYLQPKTYSSRADIAVLRTGTIVSFDPKIRTVSDADLNVQALDSLVRRRALTAVGSNLDLYRRVVELIGTQLPERLRDPARLMSVVSITNDADVFSVTVTTDNADTSALIANTWAKEYVSRVNALFSDTADSEEIVTQQAAEAKQDYDTKQAAVLTFMQSSQIEVYKRQQALLIGELDAQVTLVNKLQQLSADVQALRSRLATSGATPSSADEVTRILIQANAFNNAGTTNTAFRLDIAPSTAPALTSQEQLAQLDDLAQAIDVRRTAVPDSQMQTWYAQLSTVQGQLEQSQQQLKEIQAARDLAWNTYQTLNNKVAEVHVSNGSDNELVRIASPAAAPTAPNAVRTTLNLLIGGLLGLVIGFVLALVLDFRRGRTRVQEPALT